MADKEILEQKPCTERSTPLWALNQISLKRQSLERNTDELHSKIESLRVENQELGQKIDKSMTQLQQEQLCTEKILASDWMSDGYSKTSDLRRAKTEQNISGKDDSAQAVHATNRHSFHDKEVEYWTPTDVESWLQSRDLHKFSAVFKKNSITGKDLVDLKLNFLSDNDVMGDDREQLLSEIYCLINPRLSPKPEPELKLQTSLDREKYAAALQVMRTRDSRSSSPSLVVFSSRSSSPASSVTKQKSRSESGMDGSGWSDTTPTSSARKYLKRKSAPFVGTVVSKSQSGSSLFEAFRVAGPQCVQCVVFRRSEEGFGFICNAECQGLLAVQSVDDQMCSLQTGDLILEMNGVLLIRGENSGSLDLAAERIMKKSESLQLVVARKHCRSCSSEVPLGVSSRRSSSESTDNNHKALNSQLAAAEDRWEQLRKVLVVLKEETFEPAQLLKNIPANQVEDLKDKYVLQEEVQQLQEALYDHVSKLDNLQLALEDKASALSDVERQRDAALTRLKQITSIKPSQVSGDPSFAGSGVYAQTWENISSRSKQCTKAEILTVLKETLVEASRQKTYLDHLMTVVIEQSPWLLEEVDADFNNLSITGEVEEEEFC